MCCGDPHEDVDGGISMTPLDHLLYKQISDNRGFYYLHPSLKSLMVNSPFELVYQSSKDLAPHIIPLSIRVHVKATYIYRERESVCVFDAHNECISPKIR